MRSFSGFTIDIQSDIDVKENNIFLIFLFIVKYLFTAYKNNCAAIYFQLNL